MKKNNRIIICVVGVIICVLVIIGLIVGINKLREKKKIDKEIEEDLISENQRLRMENEYLKKLNALVQEREKSKKLIK